MGLHPLFKGFVGLSLLILLGCQLVESEPQWDNPSDPSSKAYLPRSSSSQINDDFSSSSQVISSSSSNSTPIESSSQGAVSSEGCVLADGAWVNRDCRYTSDQYITGLVTIGSEAHLHFSDNARLIIIGGELRIQSSAILSFGLGAYVHVASEGQIVVQGNSLNPVLFQAENGAEPWGIAGDAVNSAGIYIDQSSAPGSSLEYAQVSGARVGVFVGGDSLVNFVGCSFTDNVQFGLALYRPQASGAFSSLSFSGNGIADLWVDLPALSNVGEGFVFEKGIAFHQAELTTNLTLPSYSYLALGPLALSNNAVLTVSAGSQIRFATGAYLHVSQGRLRVLGTAQNPVLMEPSDPNSFWGDESLPSKEYQTAIHFDQGCLSGSLLESVIIRRARTALSNWCAEPLEVRNSEIVDYLYYALSGASSAFQFSGTSRIESNIPGSALEF